jgi:predicted RNA binding protein YcfA (HicA-like mRNA interferase family)
MPKIPRNISGRKLANCLRKYNYRIIRETGSHIRLVTKIKPIEHKITIPDHPSIKIGTLNKILRDIAEYLGKNKQDLLTDLFGK